MKSFCACTMSVASSANRICPRKTPSPGSAASLVTRPEYGEKIGVERFSSTAILPSVTSSERNGRSPIGSMVNPANCAAVGRNAPAGGLDWVDDSIPVFSARPDWCFFENSSRAPTLRAITNQARSAHARALCSLRGNALIIFYSFLFYSFANRALRLHCPAGKSLARHRARGGTGSAVQTRRSGPDPPMPPRSGELLQAIEDPRGLYAVRLYAHVGRR